MVIQIFKNHQKNLIQNNAFFNLSISGTYMGLSAFDIAIDTGELQISTHLLNLR